MALNRLTLAEQVVNAVRFAPPAVEGPIVGETNPEHEPAPVPTAEEIAAQLADLRQEAYAEAFQQGLGLEVLVENVHHGSAATWLP